MRCNTMMRSNTERDPLPLGDIPVREPLVNPTTQREIRNAHVLSTKRGRFLQSYDTTICAILRGATPQVYLDPEFYAHSKSTIQHRSAFLGETSSETEAHLRSGKYKFLELN